MGVRAQFLFSRNCLFISVTGEELARIAERVGRRQLFRFDCHQARVVFGKKLGAAVIGVRVEGRIEIKNRQSLLEILRSESHFKLSPKLVSRHPTRIARF